MISFNRQDYFPIKNKTFFKDLIFLLKDILVDFRLKNNNEICDISSLSFLREDSLLFLNGQKNILDVFDKNICLITNEITNFDFNYENIILVKNLDAAYRISLNHIYHHDDNIDYFDDFNYVNGSYISKYSKIDKTVRIGKNCTIARGVKINKDVIIKSNVSIKNSIILDNVVISDNCTIGSTGFGFDFDNRGALNLSPQLGIVYIDSNSYIGSNCCIDRGKIDITYIGQNCMIDNLVHIAHNVFI